MNSLLRGNTVIIVSTSSPIFHDLVLLSILRDLDMTMQPRFAYTVVLCYAGTSELGLDVATVGCLHYPVMRTKREQKATSIVGSEAAAPGVDMQVSGQADLPARGQCQGCL
ncbi:hypothetical protein F4801DRAFT_531770 [Xylaria longipes]|nr:hypothetical protein F4801DRAFT_531770 [Xylaria longipes]